MADNKIDNEADDDDDDIIDYEGVDDDENDDVCKAECDKCGCTFQFGGDEEPLNQALFDTFDRLMRVEHTCGYHEPYYCSDECLRAATERIRQYIVDKYGTECSKCSAKLGDVRMQLCRCCKKLICESCSFHNPQRRTAECYCSEECSARRP